MKQILNKKNTPLSILALLVLVLSVTFVISNVQKSQQTQSNAGANSVQAQCSVDGKVELAFSFTNSEAYAADLDVVFGDPNDPNAPDATLDNIAAGETKTGVLATGQTSVADGNLSFFWSPNDQNSTANGGDELKPYTALDCASSTGTPAPSASASATPTSTLTGTVTPSASDSPTLVPTITDLPTPVVTSAPTPTPTIIPTSKTAADLNDDGNVNQVDYNLFIREISTQLGN